LSIRGDYNGKMIVPTIERHVGSSGEIAPIGGPDTLLTLVLPDDPLSNAGVLLHVGQNTDDEMLLVYQGVHYRISGRQLYWLGTAPFPLTSSSVLEASVITKGLTA
jgi:hypothetical protein